VAQIRAQQYRKLFIVFGVVRDKELKPVLSELPQDACYYFCQANIPRALEAEELHRLAGEAGLHGSVVKDVNAAIREAERVAQPGDFIFIGGSTFVVAEIENL
jgi:dihydrofolate synthase/folylpolyglutamate synthase